jgi:hypothetical protein
MAGDVDSYVNDHGWIRQQWEAQCRPSQTPNPVNTHGRVLVVIIQLWCQRPLNSIQITPSIGIHCYSNVWTSISAAWRVFLLHWRDDHCIALVLGTILRTIDWVYLQLPHCNPPLVELKASQSEQSHILHPMTSVACAFFTGRHWLLCWIVAQLGQLENYSVWTEMYEIWDVKVVCDSRAMLSVANCPRRKNSISSWGSTIMRCLVVV